MRALAALALTAAALLPGCVAVVVPVAAVGVIGKRQLDRGGDRAAPARAEPAPPPTTIVASLGEQRLVLLPVGTVLPPPGAAAVAPVQALTSGWRALVRHVATAMTAGAACPEGTTAVLIDAGVAGADAGERDAAVASLNALQTMGASVTFVGTDPVAARMALVAAGMAAADTAIVSPGDMGRIARRGCVVATGGGARADFAGLAWFALPTAAQVANK